MVLLFYLWQGDSDTHILALLVELAYAIEGAYENSEIEPCAILKVSLH